MNTKKNALELLEKISGRPLTLGSAIWSIRTSDEFSQVEFAEKLGVSKQYLCDLEHDRKSVSLKQAVKFAKLLDHSMITFVQLAIQDQLNNERLKLKVNLQEVA